MLSLMSRLTYPVGRTPHGVRGLKYNHNFLILHAERRTPHGVRGLKSGMFEKMEKSGKGRTPHGVRGLKYDLTDQLHGKWMVAPLTGCVD